MIDPEDMEALDEAFGTFREFAGELRRAPGEVPWFGELLASLLDAARREFGHLKLGLERSAGITAWACRNLLELNVYTHYVLQSEANARRFALNRVADGIDTFESFQAW